MQCLVFSAKYLVQFNVAQFVDIRCAVDVACNVQCVQSMVGAVDSW